MSGILLPDHPPILGPRRESPAGFRWMVLHTRSRQEKATAEVVAGAGGDPYVPLHRRVMYYGHRKRVVEAPLFSCYLFLWGLPEHAYAAISAKRVAQIIQVPDQVGFARELAQVRAAIDAGAVLGPHRYLTAGRRARVTSGPFQGIEGLVEAQHSDRAGNVAGGAQHGDRVGRRAQANVPDNEIAGMAVQAFDQAQLSDVERLSFRHRADHRMKRLSMAERMHTVDTVRQPDDFVIRGTHNECLPQKDPTRQGRNGRLERRTLWTATARRRFSFTSCSCRMLLN